MIVLLMAVLVVIALLAGCSTTEVHEPHYDYAGPDGTLNGLPWTYNNYVVVDNDTGDYYFLIENTTTGSITLCPRLDADGKPWQMPSLEGGQ